jgi:hypothetical protein
VKLYICWGACPVPGGSPCRLAFEALEEAGHDPDVIKAYGARLLPHSLRPSDPALDAQRLIEDRRVPLLVTDDGEVVSETENIIAWAKRHPAPASSA